MESFHKVYESVALAGLHVHWSGSAREYSNESWDQKIL